HAQGPAADDEVDLLMTSAVGILDVVLHDLLAGGIRRVGREPDDPCPERSPNRPPHELRAAPGHGLHLVDPDRRPAVLVQPTRVPRAQPARTRRVAHYIPAG